MCRSIKTLRRPDGAPTDEELQAAALQFVRKVSGYRVPSQANREAFDRAVAEIAGSTRALMDNLVSTRLPKPWKTAEVYRPGPTARPAAPLRLPASRGRSSR